MVEKKIQFLSVTSNFQNDKDRKSLSILKV